MNPTSDASIPHTGKSDNRNWHPFLSRTKTFLIHEEIYGKPIRYDELVALIKSLPLGYWIRIASMGSLFLDHYQNRSEYQGILFHYLCPPNLLKEKIQTHDDRERFLFHRTQFRALLKLALLHAPVSLSSAINEEDQREITTRCLLGISSLLYETEADKEMSDFETQALINRSTFDFRRQLTLTQKSFLMNLVQLYHHHLNENLKNVIGRYKDMVFDIPNDPSFKPQGISPHLLSDVLEKEAGLTTSEYAALTFGVLVKYIRPDDIFKKEFHFPVDKVVHFSKSSINKQTIEDYFKLVSQSHSEFLKQEITRSLPRPINDFRCFMLRPLIHLDNSNDCYPTSLMYLQRLLDDALTWVVSGGAFRGDLRSYWGQVFEFYCQKICRRITANSQVKPRYFRELEYGLPNRRKKSCDAILVYGQRAVMMEFKIRSLRLVDSIINKDFDCLMDDIKTTFVASGQGDKAAAQIDESIRAIRTGDLRLPGVDTLAIQSYFPVVVTLQQWPLGPFVYELIRRSVQNEGVLRQSCCAPLEVWSCEDFEYVEAALTSGSGDQIDMPDLILQKIMGQHNNLSMAMFLYDKYSSNLPQNVRMDAMMDEMLQIILNTLSLGNQEERS